MRAMFVFVIIALLTPWQVNAQVSRPYQLRPVAATEFEAAIQSLVQTNRDATQDIQNLVHDFMRRYVTPDPTISFAEILDVYRAVAFAPVTPSPELAIWNSALVSAWLKEHPLNLDLSAHFMFTLNQIPLPDASEVYEITALARDFVGDGGHEWLLTLSIGENNTGYTFHTTNYLLAMHDSWGGYHITTFPLPWIARGYATAYDITNSTLQPLVFEDLTGSGSPVWVVTSSAYIYLVGYVYVLAWRNGRVVDLTRSPTDSNIGYVALPFGATIDFVPSSGQRQRDILIRNIQTDNWGCQNTDVQRVRWNGEQWVVIDRHTEYAQMAGCAWRSAEAAMWGGRWQAAITQYHNGLIDSKTDTVKPKGELVDYVLFRLALAYMLNSQPLEASVISTIFRLRPPTSELMRQLHGIMPRRPIFDPYPICVAAHDIFQRFQDAENPDNYGYGALPTTIIVGMTLDDVASIERLPLWAGPKLPDPSKAGCDIAVPLLAHLRAHSFSISASPADQLQKLGYPVTQALRVDIDQDGQSEWLVWLALDTPPLFFAPDPDRQTYHISDAPFRAPLHVFNGMVRKLPTGGGSVLITLTTRIDSGDQKKCPPTRTTGQLFWSSPVGALSLSRLQNGELIPFLVAPLCNTEDFFVFGSRFSSLGQNVQAELPTSIVLDAPVTSRKPGLQADFAEVTFTWDAKTGRYQPPAQVNQQDEPTDLLRPFNYEFELHFDQVLAQRDYIAALTIADQALLTPCADCRSSDYVQHHFWRATVLEMMGRASEAIAEYRFVATNATTPDQYLLAARHIVAADF